MFLGCDNNSPEGGGDNINPAQVDHPSGTGGAGGGAAAGTAGEGEDDACYDMRQARKTVYR